MLRLETAGPNPVQAAEELDRLQAALSRDGAAAPVAERVADLCAAWATPALRGERARAWLVLVGAFGLEEHAPLAAALAEDPGLPPALRVGACRVLGRLGGPAAAVTLPAVARSRSEAGVRVAAVEALMELRDPAHRPVLEALLEEDLPRPLWNAVAAALERV